MGQLENNQQSLQVWSRRGFLTAATALASASTSRILAQPMSTAEAPTYPGRYVAKDDADYERWRVAMPWQLYKAPRYPDVIVRPNHASEVAEVVRASYREGRRLAIKSGGHNVSEVFLRDGGLLLDLGELQGLQVSADQNSAWVEPALWSHGLLGGLAAHGKAFPVSHCATVPMGGFLLGGGIGYNHDNWGVIGCNNIIAAEVVTPSGEQLTVSADEHPDLLWAVKGGGMGFPGIATRLQLALYPAPGSVMESALIFPVGELKTALELLSDWAARKPKDTELMMLIAHNPTATDQTPADARKLVIVRAVTYADSEAQSRQTLSELINHPLADRAIMTAPPKSTSLEQMSVESINPALGLGFGRYAVDTVWTDQLEAMAEPLKQQILEAPSPKTHFVVSPKVNRILSDGAAFSVVGDTFIGAYTVWDEAASDAANFSWLEKTAHHLRGLSCGQYINEVDAFQDPSAPSRCFSPEAWGKLARIRQRYDPKGVLYGWPA
ncbi:FAD-binding protein [Luminiphilus sp.]|nr:FAD-binding protein [Luminiphilus sp.]